MRVLVAPQEFKGSLTAVEAAQAIAAGIRDSRANWEVDALPLADGGPGFLDALVAAGGGEVLTASAHDALGRPRLARFGLLADQSTAVVEAAEANGLTLIPPGERDALHSSTFGVGELLIAATAGRPRTIVVGVGGSATTDGGAGMARALGARLWSVDGRELPSGGAPLSDLARLDWVRPPEFAGIEVVVACDVTNPLVGPNGAAAVYGPQKGASPADVDALDAALTRFAMVVRRSLGVEIAALAGAGAAGGLAGGLVAFLGARLVSGFEVVASAVGLPARLASADVVVTGEGSFDAQSLQGKTTGRVCELALAAGKPAVVFAGRATHGLDCRTITSLEPDPEVAMRDAGALLRRLAREWATTLPG